MVAGLDLPRLHLRRLRAEAEIGIEVGQDWGKQTDQGQTEEREQNGLAGHGVMKMILKSCAPWQMAPLLSLILAQSRSVKHITFGYVTSPPPPLKKKKKESGFAVMLGKVKNKI